MQRDVARQRYLARYIAAGLPEPPPVSAPWRHVLVLPAYRESPDLLTRLAWSLRDTERALVLVLLNRPEHDPDERANSDLRAAIAALPSGSGTCRQLATDCELYCHDLELLSGATPKKQGVGLVRKIGCDLAFSWMAAGVIESDWICCTDADAILPCDYFDRLEGIAPASGAAVYPFEHLPGPDRDCNAATALYELRLHHYVLGLDYAASPYTYHTLGSTLAVRGGCYARVRGFPRRAGGEDFYLLNKVAKLGAVTRLEGEAIGLQSRRSRRVPFGTGPAVEAIAAAGRLEHQPRFYHPMCFKALRIFLSVVPDLLAVDLAAVPDMLAAQGLDHGQAAVLAAILRSMALQGAITHCRTHARTQDQFMVQFHQWFDAFRTLKLIHALRDELWPACSLREMASLKPRLWPSDPEEDVEIDALRAGVRNHWHWLSPRHPGDW